MTIRSAPVSDIRSRPVRFRQPGPDPVAGMDSIRRVRPDSPVVTTRHTSRIGRIDHKPNGRTILPMTAPPSFRCPAKAGSHEATGYSVNIAPCGKRRCGAISGMATGVAGTRTPARTGRPVPAPDSSPGFAHMERIVPSMADRSPDRSPEPVSLPRSVIFRRISHHCHGTACGGPRCREAARPRCATR